jgi:hypothetical protein
MEGGILEALGEAAVGLGDLSENDVLLAAKNQRKGQEVRSDDSSLLEKLMNGNRSELLGQNFFPGLSCAGSSKICSSFFAQ